MDVLADILASVHLGGGVRFHCEMAGPWGMGIPRSQVAEFHLLVRGNAWLRMPGSAQPIALQGGDFVAVLGGGEHSLSDRPDGAVLPIDRLADLRTLDGYGPLRFGGDGLPAQLLCGYFTFDRSSLHPLLSALPRVIHLRGGELPQASWLQTTLQFMQHETQAARPGAEAVVNRLVGVLFIQMVRRYFEQHPQKAGVLAGMADRHVGKSLALLHKAPQSSWTLESLAREVGLSRSAFATRFHQLVGQTPMHYLTVWRMQLARQFLADGNLSTAAIASKVGFESTAAFSKAFKRMTGKTPGVARQTRPEKCSTGGIEKETDRSVLR
jgi:AraC-like DNA-binding protein